MERKANQIGIGKVRIANVANSGHRSALEVVVGQYVERGREAVVVEKRLQRGAIRVRVAVFCPVISIAVVGRFFRLSAVVVAVAVAVIPVAVIPVVPVTVSGRSIEVGSAVIRPVIPVPSVPVGVVAIPVMGSIRAAVAAVGERRAAVGPMIIAMRAEMRWPIAAMVRAVVLDSRVFLRTVPVVVGVVIVGVEVSVGPVGPVETSIGFPSQIGPEAAFVEAAGVGGVLICRRLLDVADRRLHAVVDGGSLSRPEVAVRREVGLVVETRSFLTQKGFRI